MDTEINSHCSQTGKEPYIFSGFYKMVRKKYEDIEHNYTRK